MYSFRPLTAVGMAIVRDIASNADMITLNYLESVLDSFVFGRISQNDAANIFIQTIGNSSPIARVAQILSVPMSPLSEHAMPHMSSLTRTKKTKPWTAIEDTRLLAAIHMYGLEAWGTVAKFIGNSRTKAQCAQRWSRGLDPRIAKIHWSQEEDEMLLASVERHGVKCWTLIASEIPSRSDVQCRYRYKQLTNDKKNKAEKNVAQQESPQVDVLTVRPVSKTIIPIHSMLPSETKEKILLPSIDSFVLT